MNVFFVGNLCFVCLFCEYSKLVELSGIEIQKLRINLRSVQEKNLQLAQANSQMLAVCPILLCFDFVMIARLFETIWLKYGFIVLFSCFSCQELNTNRDRVSFSRTEFSQTDAFLDSLYYKFFNQLTLYVIFFQLKDLQHELGCKNALLKVKKHLEVSYSVGLHIFHWL